MISTLVGTVESKNGQNVEILTSGGVGYSITLTLTHAAELVLNNTVKLSVYLRVAEDALDLYGFRTEQDKKFFSLLLTVSGVGPKSAMNILSLGSVEQIKAAIARKDVAYLTAVQGMGKKTAERLIVELQGKVGAASEESGSVEGSETLRDVIDGLVALGYTKEQARDAATSVSAEGKSVSEVLKEALQKLSH